MEEDKRIVRKLKKVCEATEDIIRDSYVIVDRLIKKIDKGLNNEENTINI